MRPDSVRSLKAEFAAEVIAQAGDSIAARSFFEASRPPTPENVALGIAKRSDGEHVLAIRTPHPEVAERLAARARGEADVRIVRAERRPTDARLASRLRPLEVGCQIGMAGRGFVGTLGFFGRDAAGVLHAVSNSHVVADQGRALPGHRIGQPSALNERDLIGLLAVFALYSPSVPNLADVGSVRLDRNGLEVLPGFHPQAERNGGRLRGARRFTAEDLGIEVRKLGRSTGAQAGRITVVEVDGLPVAMDAFTPRFDDATEVSGGPGSDFSAPGDSGSLIVDLDGWGGAHLFAGGRDRTGEDFTYGLALPHALAAVGLTLATQ